MKKLKQNFVERIKKELSQSDFDKYIESLEKEETHGLTINLHKLDKSSIDLKYIVDEFEGNIVFKNDNFCYMTYDKIKLQNKGMYPGKHPLHHAGLYYIQEPSASRVLYDVDIRPYDKVLDLCASPGGKSTEVLFSLDKSKGGFLLANDVDYMRAKTLSSNIERIGFDNVAITCESAEKLADEFSNYFDKVIVDAPCSGEGMFRKSEEARLQWSLSRVTSLAKLQKKLIDCAYAMLRESGLLIYSTCTFSKEEDEEVVDYLIKKYDDMSLTSMEKQYPFNSIGEGQFFAICKKGNVDAISSSGEFDYDRLNNINLIRCKVEEFTYQNKIKTPTHASSHIDSVIFENVVELDDNDIEKYLKGEAIRMNLSFSGFCKITYKNIGVGIAKYSNGILKNHYPKGLRNN